VDFADFAEHVHPQASPDRLAHRARLDPQVPRIASAVRSAASLGRARRITMAPSILTVGVGYGKKRLM
jgi:hypothetical protein